MEELYSVAAQLVFFFFSKMIYHVTSKLNIKLVFK